MEQPRRHHLVGDSRDIARGRSTARANSSSPRPVSFSILLIIFSSIIIAHPAAAQSSNITSSTASNGIQTEGSVWSIPEPRQLAVLGCIWVGIIGLLCYRLYEIRSDNQAKQRKLLQATASQNHILEQAAINARAIHSMGQTLPSAVFDSFPASVSPSTTASPSP